MGRELAAASPVFAARLAECGRALAPHVDWDLEQVLAGADGAPALDRADVVQPALWAVMVSLAAVWQAAGVVPDAVAGHSQGEIAAACVAGMLSLEDAARVVAVRSRALAALAGRGRDGVGGEPAARVRELLGRWGDRLSVAAVNGPAATVVSGDPAALAELAAACEAGGVRARVLPVDYVSHSAQVEELRAEILAGAGRDHAGSGAGAGGLGGDRAVGGRARSWTRGTGMQPAGAGAVRPGGEGAGRGRAPGVRRGVPASGADRRGHRDAGRGRGRARAVLVTGTLRRGTAGRAGCWRRWPGCTCAASPVDWAAVLGGGRRVGLPTYAFQRQRYWPRPPAGAGRRRRRAARRRRHGSGRRWRAATCRPWPRRWRCKTGRLAEVLPALTSWRHREKDKSAANWRYRVGWAPVPTRPAALSGTWLAGRRARGRAGGGAGPGRVRARGAGGAEAARAAGPSGAGRRTPARPPGAVAVATGADETGRCRVTRWCRRAWRGRWRWCRPWVTPGWARRCGC